MPDSLCDRVVVVTGGAGGIGRALGRALRARGARTVLLDLRADTDVIACDITDPAACERVMSEIVAQHGAIDVLINNAGITHRSPFVDTDAAVLRQVMEVNFFGSVTCTRAALPHLLRSRGRIVAVSSVAGFAPLVGRTAYAASKHAMHGFFDSLRAELAGTGVDVTMVCPYYVDSGLRADSPAPTLGRALTADEVAAAIVDGCERRRRLLVLGSLGKLSWWVSRFAPRAYEAAMRRSQPADA